MSVRVGAGGPRTVDRFGSKLVPSVLWIEVVVRVHGNLAWVAKLLVAQERSGRGLSEGLSLLQGTLKALLCERFTLAEICDSE